jgi:uncharacterized RDD family membrane protein YckC
MFGAEKPSRPQLTEVLAMSGETAVDAPKPDATDTPDTEPTAAPGYPKAALGPRLHAETIDGLVAVGPVFIAAFVLGSLPDVDALILVRPVLVLACYVWAFYYGFAKDGWPAGQSFGKRRAGLMVVHLATGKPCSRGQSSIRTLILVATKALPLAVLIEPIVVLLSRDGRRVGDRAAGTQVIPVSAYDRCR